MVNYSYTETAHKDIRPQEGGGWEYWADRIVKDKSGNVLEQVAVWRRDSDEYGETDSYIL